MLLHARIAKFETIVNRKLECYSFQITWACREQVTKISTFLDQ